MKSLSGTIKIAILLVLLLAVAGLQHLYLKDSESLEKVRAVLTEVQAYCAVKKLYPDKEIFNAIVARHDVTNPKEWILFTSKDLKKGALQYPMNLPILWAPGEAKISEFIPTIYAFIIKDPCSL